MAFVEGHGLQHWAGVLAFAAFLTVMTLGRIVGTGLLDRYGRVPVLRVSFALAAIGAAMVIFGSAWVAFAGAAVWGLGSALGFPVGMSASADDAERAAARMSVVATIGYGAFLGPPVLGLLGTGSACSTRCSSSARSPCWPWPSCPPCGSPPRRGPWLNPRR